MIYPQMHFQSRALWRKWLKANHNKSNGIWFIFYKEHTGLKNISYNDAVEEALCYGWIDSIIKKLDDNKYQQKFTPRTNNYQWSPSNIERMKKLIKEKKMTKPGLSKFPEEALKGTLTAEAKPGASLVIPSFFEKMLKKDKTVFTNFQNLASSYRKNYLRWVASAKKEETQIKRMNELIGVLKQNKKLGLK